MRIAIVGSRSFIELWRVDAYMSDLYVPDTVIVSGGAKGVDTRAQEVAVKKGIKTAIYLPDWDKYGRSAGMLRNTDIVNNSDVVVAFWDGKSKGTFDTISKALKAEHIKKVIVFKEK